MGCRWTKRRPLVHETEGGLFPLALPLPEEYVIGWRDDPRRFSIRDRPHEESLLPRSGSCFASPASPSGIDDLDQRTIYHKGVFPCGRQNVQVIYTGGFATVPDDLGALVANADDIREKELYTLRIRTPN